MTARLRAVTTLVVVALVSLVLGASPARAAVPTVSATHESWASFGFASTDAPVGSRLDITWRRSGAEQHTSTTATSWWSGWQYGWSDAQARLVDAGGQVLAASPVLRPTRPSPTPAPTTSAPTPTPTVPAPAPTTTTPRPTVAPTPARPPVGELQLGWNPDYANTAKAGYLILQTSQWRLLPQLRQQNPGMKIYFYSNVNAVSRAAGSGEFQPNVVTYPQAEANPQWYLRGADGTRVLWSDYDYLIPVDSGDADFQRTALANLRAEFASHGWDGVFFDDVNVDERGHSYNVKPVDYSRGSLRANTDSFLRNVAAVLKGEGRDVAINLQQSWDDWRTQVEAWTPLVDVVNLEHCAGWGDMRAKTDKDLLPTLDAQWRLDEMARIQQLGGRFWCQDTGVQADTRAQAYHRALFLLGWDGVSESASVWGPADGENWWTPTGTTDLGRPTSSVTQVQPYVYRRSFEKGTGWLNATREQVTVTTPSGPLVLQPFEAAVR